MRIPDLVLGCIGFLGQPEADGMFRPQGTAFFIGARSERFPERQIPYLVTARHNVEKAKEVDRPLQLRLNLKTGGSHIFDLAPSWVVAEQTEHDVAVMRFRPDPEVFDYKWLDSKMCASDEIIKTEGIGAGTEISITGLFSLVRGAERNVPIVRSGIIAAMPGELLPAESGGPLDKPFKAYMCEVRSLKGLSGSPAFAHAWLRVTGKKFEMLTPERILLLGLVRAHWGDTVDDLDRMKLNYGIAAVTPIEHAIALINSPSEIEYRRRMDQEDINRLALTNDDGQ